jgi:hypothetical protein
MINSTVSILFLILVLLEVLAAEVGELALVLAALYLVPHQQGSNLKLNLLSYYSDLG